MTKNTIIYVGNFAFPFGSAAGKRVYANGKALRACGYDVVFVGTDANLRENVPLRETGRVFDGFEYFNLPYPKSTREWMDYNSVFQSFLHWIQDRKDNVLAIICSESPRISYFITKLARWSKRNRICILSDCVDWLESKTGNLLFDAGKTIDTYYQKTIANKKVDGVICISTYLQRYYDKAGRETLIVPPLATQIPEPAETDAGEKIEIVYAGSPFRKNIAIKDLSTLKDRVDKMLDILKALKEKGTDFHFSYYGLGREEYLQVFPQYRDIVDYLGDAVDFYGMQKNETVMERIKTADFTLLVRDVKRATMAGFPTKVSESISCGTPVITTRTSDISLYLEDGKNVLFVDGDDPEGSAGRISEAVSAGEHRRMKENCIGNTIFHYSGYQKRLDEFLIKLGARYE